MTAILTEVQKTDELVKLARQQIDAFNNSDWGLMRGNLASDGPRLRLPRAGGAL